MTQNKKGELYVVATPIGNLKDITFRALDVFKSVDLIATEDTRSTEALLRYYKIKKPLISYHDVNERARARTILKRLEEGKDIALVSESGTPHISDPGYRLIREASKADIKIIPVPGPSSLSALLSISHIPINEFIFLGFLPRQENKKKAIFQDLIKEKRPFLIFESPLRLLSTLKIMFSILGSREVLMGREMTKYHEEIFRGDLKRLINRIEVDGIKGEVTLLVEGAKENPTPSYDEIKERVIFYLRLQNISPRKLSSIIAKEISAPVKEVYKIIVQHKEKEK